MVDGGGHIFRPDVGKKLSAASRDRADAGGTRKGLARTVIAARPVHGAWPRYDCREAFLDAAPDHVFAVALAPPVGILRITGTVFFKRRSPVIPVHAGGTDMDIALDAVFQREAR